MSGLYNFDCHYYNGYTACCDKYGGECKHILRNLLGIEIQTREDFGDNEEYQDRMNE